MGNFLVVVPRRAARAEAVALFRRGLDIGVTLGFPPDSRRHESEWACAASIPRINGTGTSLHVDSEDGSWILAIGCWFHRDGQAVGDEAHLLQRFREVGADSLARELEGFFVVAIGDAGSREVIVMTDLIGSCHAFVRTARDGIALSGSSLWLAGLESTGLDAVACQEYLYTGVMYEDRSLYREVKKLPPASVLRYADGKLRSAQKYWDIGTLGARALRGEDAVAALWDSLTRAAQRVGQAFPNIVCDLTGGYDSRATLAAFLGAGTAFSTTVSGAPDSPDVRVSSTLAAMFDIRHWPLQSGATQSYEQVEDALRFTDGEFDLVEYAGIFRIHDQLKDRFQISINGSYGEIARGYWWELLFPHIGAHRPLDTAMLARARFAVGRHDPSLIDPAVRIDLASHFSAIIARVNQGLVDAPNTLQMDNTYLHLRMQRWQGRIASATNRLWPCLSPFMFRSVLETMLQTEPRLRLRSLLIRRLLADHQPKLAEAELEHGYPAAPATWRNVHRFWPLAGYYGTKVLQKLAGRLPRLGARVQAANLPPPVRLQLWRDPELRGVLDPAPWQDVELFSSDGLLRFVERSRSPDFAFDAQWARLLSLQTARRRLQQIRP